MYLDSNHATTKIYTNIHSLAKAARNSLAALLLLLFFSPDFTAAANRQETADWQTTNPKLLHQQLAENKRANKLDQLFAEKIASQESLADALDDYDVEFYDVFIRVNDTTEILYGRVTFQVRALVDLSSLDFDFYRYMGVDSIVSGGTSLIFHRGPYDYVTFDFSDPVLAGEVVTFEVYYRGHPPEAGFQAFSFEEANGKPIISSLSEPYYARTWWPCKDRMTDKPDSMNIAIEVDTSLYCASNGTLDSTIHNGDNTQTFFYRVRYPIVTYLFSVAIHPYQIWEQTYTYNGGASTMPIIHAVYPESYSFSLSAYNIVPDAIAALSDKFGPYPFLNEKYGHAHFGWGGGMEHQTVTSITPNGSGSLVIHELGHQWWGDMITCASWHDIWLNEGWASYSEAIWYEAAISPEYYHTYMGFMAYKGGGTIYVADTTSVAGIFNGNLSYDKGAWVCHMLRGVLGDELFFDGIAAYYNSEFQHGAATTEDFKNVFEASSGVELDYFFEDWIHGSYVPNYEYAWTTEPVGDGSFDCYIYVEQIQSTSPQVFRMPVPFYFEYDGGSTDTISFACDERKKLIKYNVANDVNSITLDPRNWVLKYASQQAMQVRLVTKAGELSGANKEVAYVDTVLAIGGSGSYQFSTINGTNLPAGLSVNSNGLISGIPTSGGLFTFTLQVLDVSSSETDTIELSIFVNQCCGQLYDGFTGDVTCGGDGKVSLSDITILIDRVYISKEPLCCEEDGNVDGDIGGLINLSDITRLIDHVYISRAPSAPCQ